MAEALLKGSKGRWLAGADLSEAALEGLHKHTEEQVVTRIPAELLPNVGEEVRRKMRPDILFVTGLDEGKLRATAGDPQARHRFLQAAKANCTVNLIEVGYCRDDKAPSKAAHKMRQHLELQDALVKEGWTVQVVPIVLGHCGSVYYRDMEAVQKLGVDKAGAKALFTALHDNAVKYTCAAARTYQQLRAEKNRAFGYRWQHGRQRGRPP